MIINMMDGQDSRNARVKEADARIDKSFYKDDHSQFTFEQYCSIHITSNIEMDELNVGHDSFTQVRKFLDGIKHPSMKGLKFLIMDNDKTKADLQAAVIKMKDLWNQSKPAASNTNRSRDERTIGNINIGNHRGGGQGQDSRGGHNNRGGRNEHNAGRGHGHYAGTTGRGCVREQNSDYIPQEVLNSLTPQQCWYLLQGQDALSQADTTTSTAHQNERTVGAGTTNTETASMVSGISQNMLASGVPSPTMTGTHW